MSVLKTALLVVIGIFLFVYPPSSFGLCPQDGLRPRAKGERRADQTFYSQGIKAYYITNPQQRGISYFFRYRLQLKGICGIYDEISEGRSSAVMIWYLGASELQDPISIAGALLNSGRPNFNIMAVEADARSITFGKYYLRGRGPISQYTSISVTGEPTKGVLIDDIEAVNDRITCIHDNFVYPEQNPTLIHDIQQGDIIVVNNVLHQLEAKALSKFVSYLIRVKEDCRIVTLDSDYRHMKRIGKNILETHFYVERNIWDLNGNRVAYVLKRRTRERAIESTTLRGTRKALGTSVLRPSAASERRRALPRAQRPKYVWVGTIPSRKATLLALGRQARRKGDFEKAESLFTQAWRLDKMDKHTIVELTRVCLRMRKFRDALIWSDRILLLPGHQRDIQAYVMKIRALFGMNRINLAGRVCDEVMRFEPENAALRVLRIKALRYLGRLDEARIECDRYLKLWPSHIELITLRAQLAMDQGRYYEAMHFLRDVLQLRPNDIFAITLLKQASQLDYAGQRNRVLSESAI